MGRLRQRAEYIHRYELQQFVPGDQLPQAYAVLLLHAMLSTWRTRSYLLLAAIVHI
jgi:hypothetical protein